MIARPRACPEPRPAIRLTPAAARRQRLLERTSPSALEGGDVRLASGVLKAKSAEAFGIGTLVHAWLGEVEWLDDGLPNDDVLRQIAARERSKIGNIRGQLDAHIQRFRGQLTASAIAGTLCRRFYDSPANLGLTAFASNKWPAGKIELVVKREHLFAIRSGDEILTGSIDRLVIVQHNGRPIAADIIDFKTDDLLPGDEAALDDKRKFYRPQIEAYRGAASRILGLAPEMIGARLIFLAAGQSVAV
jgi:ATP-dependent exoDNAse (exonuclease V) beta subunit